MRDASDRLSGRDVQDRLLDMGRVVVIPPGTSRADVVTAFTVRERRASRRGGGVDRGRPGSPTIMHPLMGELTVREMLLFFVVHERHHLKLVRTRLEPLIPNAPDA